MNPELPLISVITPCFNCGEYIERSAASVLQQTHGRLELIVVNDGSTDDTEQRLGKLSDPRLRIFRQANKGVSSARNLGLKYASGEFVAFLDADDEWEPAFLEKMLLAMNSDQYAAVAYCGWRNLGVTGGRGMPYVPPNYQDEGKWKQLLLACPWPIHGALSRLDAVREAGGFDRRFSIGEDYLLWLELAYHGNLVLVPEVLAYYHHHEGIQATKNKVRLVRETWEVKREFLRRHPDVMQNLGSSEIKDLVDGQLFRRAYEYYCQRDFETAHAVFRLAMRAGVMHFREWKYCLPALLPLSVFCWLVRAVESYRAKSVT